MKFHPDPTNPKEMICDDCFKALQEVNEDWMNEDNEDDLNFWFGDEDEDTEDDTDED